MIRERGDMTAQFESELERYAPQKKLLWRANPYNCTACFADNRTMPSKFCALCQGTGYLDPPTPFSYFAPPAATLFLITCDIQTGKGLYGTGGGLFTSISDFGQSDVGDGIGFAKFNETDYLGRTFNFPESTSDLIRPDVLIDPGKPSVIWFVNKTLELNVGDEIVGIALMLSLNRPGVAAAVR